MGHVVSAGKCAMFMAIAATGAGCEKAPQARIAAAVAVEDVPEVARSRGGSADLGGGCSADPPRAVDHRDWPDAATVRRAALASDGRALYALDDHRRLSLWRDGSSERGFELFALAIREDGVPLGPQVTLSNGVIGAPVAFADDKRGVTVWFFEDTDTDNEPRRIATSVHCAQ
jgi:hypothetical protein